ncbi:MAG: crossover junction endodeoxyribonuclease RuvC, partial [Bacteroidia bacterium]
MDPGTTVLGYAIIEIKKKNVSVLTLGIVNLSKINEHPEKLQKIYERIEQLILAHRPTEMAIEAPFFGKNVQSMLKLGRAQGVAMAAAMVNKISVSEFSPRKIKQSITGNGNASKEQVSAMLVSLLKIDLFNEKLDATDALAAALCCHYQSNS